MAKPAREPASNRPNPCASLKNSHESCPFAAPCWPVKKSKRGACKHKAATVRRTTT